MTPQAIILLHQRPPTDSIGVCEPSEGCTSLPARRYADHSFRAEAATTAALAETEDPLIKIMGRWESSVYLLYIHIPQAQLQSIAAALSQVSRLLAINIGEERIILDWRCCYGDYMLRTEYVWMG